MASQEIVTTEITCIKFLAIYSTTYLIKKKKNTRKEEKLYSRKIR